MKRRMVLLAGIFLIMSGLVMECQAESVDPEIKKLIVSAEQGDVDAQCALGLIYSIKGAPIPQDYKEALKWYKKAAEQGDDSAQFYVAHMYYSGQGVPPDYKEALKWYKKAAEQGDDSAQFYVALMYYKGQGIPQDYKEALKWYKKAAEQGDDSAQDSLASMYYKGQGVPQNYVLAHKWFNLAATEGDKHALKNRDLVASKMTPEQIEEAQNLAREWMPQK